MRRRKGRRNLADFENIPVTTHVHELSAEERACPCCGTQRQEIGADESWQIEYYPGHFERIQHLRKKYACPDCESKGDGARIQAAAKPEAPVDKGLAGPGLLSYIVTSKFSDYLPLLCWQPSRNWSMGFVSLTEALDLTTPAGRAMAGLLAIFAEFEREILRERTKAGLAHARENGKRLGRPASAAAHAGEVRKLYQAGLSKSEIGRRLRIGRTSVRRIQATDSSQE